ncbi:transposase [Xylocopilactobacillus apicola]|uniref:Transposase IS204/IS1001/IS1096/IS1165 DDE domain-containing protein n=1 Tax=Xylocopilactobacillus apicola TaxID=2932184 RepID=A0AAU9DSY4_9LACO|nr:transposase [Xylocopilactobacillus apicola]BDR58433.1 hypothetical protein XA3_08740 [Xylocopilactobacillus apicola]
MFSSKDFISNLLGIKDPNITLDENNPFETQMIGDVEAVIYHAVLTYTLKHCPNCGFKGQIVKNRTKTSRILLPNNNPRVSYLDLKKQRFLCRKCQSTTTAKTNVVKRSRWISEQVKLSVNLEAMHNSSLKDIAERHGISASSVQRLIIEANPSIMGNQCHHLPEHLLFDETKTTGGMYSFVMMDSRQHQLLEMLPSRLTKDLKRYFGRFSLAERQRIKTIVVDLNAAYVSFIPQIFPNAEIIIDRFHLVQMPNR